MALRTASISPYGGSTTSFRPDLMFSGSGISCSGSPSQSWKPLEAAGSFKSSFETSRMSPEALPILALLWPGSALAWPCPGLVLRWPGPSQTLPWPGSALHWPFPGLGWPGRALAWPSLTNFAASVIGPIFETFPQVIFPAPSHVHHRREETGIVENRLRSLTYPL